MNITDIGVSFNNYEAYTNKDKKRERKELPQPLAHFFKKPATFTQPGDDVDVVEVLERKVRTVSFKRDRDEEEKVEESAQLKKANQKVDDQDYVEIPRNRVGKRQRDEENLSDLSLDELLRDIEEEPIIEEIPESLPLRQSCESFRSNQLALSILTEKEYHKAQFILACANGDIPSIKRYIIRNSHLLIELNQGIITTDSKLNELLQGFNTAVLNNEYDTVVFFLRLAAVRKNVHFFDNLPLQLAFSGNRVTIICKLLQLSNVLGAINKPFLKTNLTTSAEKGQLFQFLVLSCLPNAKKAFVELGYNYNNHSINDTLIQCAARFPKFNIALKEFLETDFFQVSDDGPIILIKPSQILEFIAQAANVLQNDSDLPDLNKLHIN